MSSRLLFGLLLTTACSACLNKGTSPQSTDTHDSASPDTDAQPDDSGTDSGKDTSENTEPMPDLSTTGPYQVKSSTDRFEANQNCSTFSTTYLPVDAPEAPPVVLVHGFSRYESVHAELAAHWASWGLPVSTMTLCHSYVLDNDPEQDAADMTALSNQLGGGPVIYAGHSAGGMRSVLAAANDPKSIAVLGLDLVDYAPDGSSGAYLGQQKAAKLKVPLYGVHGESTDCNDSDIGLQVYAAAPDSSVLRVTEADHCDFESPTDWLCTLLCQAENASFSDEEISTTVRDLTTAFLLWQSGLEPRGEAWWKAGEEPYEALKSSGAIRVP